METDCQASSPQTAETIAVKGKKVAVTDRTDDSKDDGNCSSEPTEEQARRFIGILFPGVVKNVDKAIQCLGGERAISHFYTSRNKKRLGLSFHPENPGIKKVYGDLKSTAGVLMKVKVKKRRENGTVKREVVSTTIVGTVNEIVEFDGMCDFQYLPVHKEGTGSCQPNCLLDSYIPTGLENEEFLMKDMPPFIVPSNFTRTDKPYDYCYTKNTCSLAGEAEHFNETLGVRRRPRSSGCALYKFSLTNELPSEPYEHYIKAKEAKLALQPSLAQDIEVVSKLFEERPIWSSYNIMYKTKIRLGSLKLILPCLAVYMVSGPWRKTWVRFGYDPRKEPGARYYQTLDFRLRCHAGVRSLVSAKAFNYRKADRVRTPCVDREVDITEGQVSTRPGLVPTQRQTFYQLCEVKLPEVEALLATEPAGGQLCHETRGWLAPGAADACRDHIFNYAKEALLASNNADMKFEHSSSEDDQMSDDDEASTANDIDDSFNT